MSNPTHILKTHTVAGSLTRREARRQPGFDDLAHLRYASQNQQLPPGPVQVLGTVALACAMLISGAFALNWLDSARIGATSASEGRGGGPGGFGPGGTGR